MRQKDIRNLAYIHLEKNKDELMNEYNLERYNPTDMAKEYMKYRKNTPDDEITKGFKKLVKQKLMPEEDFIILDIHEFLDSYNSA